MLLAGTLLFIGILCGLSTVWTFDQIQVPKMQAALRNFGGTVPMVTLRGRIEVEALVQAIGSRPFS